MEYTKKYFSYVKNECEQKCGQLYNSVGNRESLNNMADYLKSDSNVSLATAAGIGVAAAATGVGITVATGGIIPTIAGSALSGAGTSLLQSSMYKHATCESLTVKESVKDAALGATIGAIAGPIGSVSSKVAQGAPAIAKVGIRAVASSGAGAVCGAVIEASRVDKMKDISTDALKKSMAIGAAVGVIGGVAAQLASSVASGIQNGIGQVMTRIAVQGTTAAATDAGIQLYQNGIIDKDQLILNTTGQLVVATSAEVGSSLAQRTSAYNNRVNSELIKNSNLSPEEAKNVKSIINEANSLKKDGELKGWKRFGENKIHNLWGDRTGQVAGDIRTSAKTGRGPERVILEKHNDKFVYVDHTMDHNYKECKPTIKNQIPNPLNQMQRTDQIKMNLLLNADGSDEKPERSYLGYLPSFSGISTNFMKFLKSS